MSHYSGISFYPSQVCSGEQLDHLLTFSPLIDHLSIRLTNFYEEHESEYFSRCQGSYVYGSVQLFVHVQDDSKRNQCIFMILILLLGLDQIKKLLNFRKHPDHTLDAKKKKKKKKESEIIRILNCHLNVF